MKALIICGGRNGGFTSTMCNSFADGLASEGIGSDVVYPIEMNIKHCNGCGSCSKSGKCVIEDDMSMIYELFESADLFVPSSPVRFSGPSSIIKIVLDRFQPYWYNGISHPSNAAALMNGGSPLPEFKNLLSVFKALTITSKVKWSGDLTISNTDSIAFEDVVSPSYDFGKDIALMLKTDDR